MRALCWTLAQVLPICNSLTHLRLTERFDPRDFDQCDDSDLVLDALFKKTHLPQLRTLQLREWAFKRQTLENILATHSASLRGISLMDCFVIFFANNEDQVLARWVGRNLQLQEIELADVERYDDYDRIYPGSIGGAWQLTKEWKYLWLGGTCDCVADI
jgi:hypothetical protein